MAIRFELDAATEVTLPLACDPSVKATPEAIAEYLRTGDQGLITWPDDVTRITVRALTEPEQAEADRAAGYRPTLGAYAFDEARAAQEGLEGEARAAAFERCRAGWNDLKRQAYDDFVAWFDRQRPAIVAAGLVAMHGEGWDGVPRAALPDHLARVPKRLRADVVAEVHTHISRLTNLGAEGKG
ncbi:MAG: hypothetical protein KC583_12590 [Myxococcales bacterium]|nr:hypothetical protein [Myxococcales bacterium]